MAAENSPTTPPALTKRQIFFRRLFSFVILWTIILAALFSGYPWLSDAVFLIIMVVLAAAGLAEFYDLAQKDKLVCFKYSGIAGGVLLMVGTFLNLTGRLGIHNSPARVNDFETSS